MCSPTKLGPKQNESRAADEGKDKDTDTQTKIVNWAKMHDWGQIAKMYQHEEHQQMFDDKQLETNFGSKLINQKWVQLKTKEIWENICLGKQKISNRIIYPAQR